MNRIAVAIGGAAVLALVAWLALASKDTVAPSSPGQPANVESPEPAPELQADAAHADPADVPAPTPLPEGLPEGFYKKLAPGERIALTVPKGLTSGIRCPDGTFLPLLNGVPVAGPISRSRMLGPLPPVVAKMCDPNGIEWYVHADGSRTTTKWSRAIVHGEPKQQVVTLHFGPMPEGTTERARETPPAPPSANGGNR